MMKNLSISKILVAIGLLFAVDVWRRIGGGYQGAIWSIPLYVAGMLAALSTINTLLTAFGDQTAVDNKAKAWLDYLAYPGMIAALLGCGWMVLYHYQDTGAEYDSAYYSGIALMLILVGNFGRVAEGIEMARHRAAESVSHMADKLDNI